MIATECNWIGLSTTEVRCKTCGCQHYPCLAPTKELITGRYGVAVLANCMRPVGHSGCHTTRCQCGASGYWVAGDGEETGR